jgi:hypothetical protein
VYLEKIRFLPKILHAQNSYLWTAIILLWIAHVSSSIHEYVAIVCRMIYSKRSVRPLRPADSMQAVQKAARLLPRQPVGQQIRNMSSHGSVEENTKWMQFWMYTTIVATPVVTAFGYYTMSHGHHDHHDAPSYPYIKKRDRKFPWGTNCDLFDFHCHGQH